MANVHGDFEAKAQITVSRFCPHTQTPLIELLTGVGYLPLKCKIIAEAKFAMALSKHSKSYSGGSSLSINPDFSYHPLAGRG